MSTTVSNNDRHAPPLPDIAGYRVLRVLNHGGMSTVYLGQQLALSREVAIKVMQPQALADEVSRRRFENEARTIARLEHPHIVSIYEVGRTGDGLPYYSMPYLARGHLGQRSFIGKNGVTDEARVIDIAARAAVGARLRAQFAASSIATSKPRTCCSTTADRPLLADFGIALRRGFGPRVTTAGLAVGSTAYMAPEQARGEDVDGRADLYSLGVLTWEMLTGHLPYQAGDALSMAVMHAQDPIPKLPASLRHWQRFMNRALAKGPLHRFQSVAHMREAVTAIEQHRVWPRLDAARERVLSLHAIAQRSSGPAWYCWPSRAWARLWLMSRDGSDSFFGVDASAPTPAVIAPDPTDAMMAPLPEAPAATCAGRHAPADRAAQTDRAGGWQRLFQRACGLACRQHQSGSAPGDRGLTNALGDELAATCAAATTRGHATISPRPTALGEQTGTATVPSSRHCARRP